MELPKKLISKLVSWVLFGGKDELNILSLELPQDDDLAPVAVGYEESELRNKLRNLHAKWSPQDKLWLVPYRLIRGTDLEARILEEYLNGSKKL